MMNVFAVDSEGEVTSHGVQQYPGCPLFGPQLTGSSRSVWTRSLNQQVVLQIIVE